MPRDFLLNSLPLPSTARPHVRWSQLHGSGLSLAAAEAAARHGGTVCVIAPSAAAADRIEHELEFFGGAPVRRFPGYETLPYEPISPPQDLLADRLLCLYQLARGERLTLVVEAGALLDRLPPREFVISRSLQLKVGDKLEHGAMIRTLTEHGYLRVEQVAEPGEFAVRGAVLDVFPTGGVQPVRIDLFDDEIESLRMFDAQTQLSSGKTDALRILPAREFPFDDAAIKAFRERFRERFPVDPTRCPVYRMISEAQLPAGIEYYLPLFFASTVTLLDYLGSGALLIAAEDALAGLDDSWSLVEERYEQLRGDIERPILAPRDGFAAPDEIRAGLEVLRTLTLVAHAAEDTDEVSAHNAGVTHPLGAGVAASDDRISRWIGAEDGERTLLATSSPGHREMMLELLRHRGREPVTFASWEEFLASDAPLGVGVAELGEGLRFPARKIRLVTSTELGMERPKQRQRRRRARDPETVIRELTDLLIGAPVVHEDHGVGRYRGLITLEVDGVLTEFLLLEYAGGDKLYVPVQSLHLVTRYSGASPEDAPLHKLGSDQWA
jgi:transcription-repair coupling factor (superfamily II helicase)